MPSKIITTESDDDVRCERCQHRVELRGAEQLVCLAHLSIFSPAQARACRYFEAKGLTVGRVRR